MLKHKEFCIITSLLLILIFCGQNMHTQTFVHFDQTCSQAYLEASRMRLNSAKSIIQEAQKKDNENKAYDFVLNYTELVNLMVNANRTDFQNFKTVCTERISSTESITTESPIRDAIVAELYFHRAMARLLFSEKIRAAFDLRKAKLLSNSNRKKHPHFDYNLKLSGLLNLITGSIPDHLKWAASLASLSGNIEEGIREINKYFRIVKEDTILNCFYPEAICLKLATTQSFDPITRAGKSPRNIIFDEQTQNEIGKNQLLTFVCADYLMKNSMNEQAINILLSRNFDDSYIAFSYLDYLTGIALQNKLDPRAVSHLFKYVLNSANRNYVKAAYQRIAWHYLINNSTEKYHEYLQSVLRFGLSNSESDNAAADEAKSLNPPDINLLKAKLLFDGGYFDRSLETLKNYQITKQISENNIEYLYRMARIYDEKNEKNTAIKYYQMVIAQSADKPWYYAANSYLMLGFMHEIRNENAFALKYYNECLKLNPNKYKVSIHQKAKAGRNRVES
jgi:hypothetical protein